MVYLFNHLDDENGYNNIPYSNGHFYRWGINQVVEHSPDRLFINQEMGAYRLKNRGLFFSMH
jgi:hypothetical protein